MPFVSRPDADGSPQSGIDKAMRRLCGRRHRGGRIRFDPAELFCVFFLTGSSII
jgi:hypothetical protein